MPVDDDRFRRRALELAARDGRGLGSRLAAEFGISRAAASARLGAMVREGLLVAKGTTRSRTYRIATIDRAGRRTLSRTIVPVRLAVPEGEKPVSRALARRITRRFERFEHVVLDFRGVEEIGQAFADEIFRVFRHEHPSVRLQPVNMAPKVEAMVRRALAAART